MLTGSMGCVIGWSGAEVRGFAVRLLRAHKIRTEHKAKLNSRLMQLDLSKSDQQKECKEFGKQLSGVYMDLLVCFHADIWWRCSKISAPKKANKLGGQK